MTVTEEMTVANIAFLLDRLAADTPPNQQIRELTQNAIEAVKRRHKAGDASEGLIRWDVDWDHHRSTGHHKLCIVDNGDGMTPDQMRQYLNSLAVQGASQTQSISQNFGVGAKITALYRNRLGLIYQSWRDRRGAMVRLHRDDVKGVYGLASFDLPDGIAYTPTLKATAKPKFIDASGTKVTLLGQSDVENTCLPAEDAGTGMNWLIRYLSGRYFRLPDNVKLQARVLTRDRDRWPDEEPPTSERTFNLQTIHGSKALFDSYAKHKGTVRLSNADAHWWLFDDPQEASKNMSTRGGRTSLAGLIFQDEVYIQRTPPAARRILASFGIVFGAEHVIIYVEPRHGADADLRADTARSRVLINGEDVEEAHWWDRWGAEFREKMPKEIKSLIEEIMARAEKDPEGKTRERILERLRRMRELLRPSRYRRSSEGLLSAGGKVPGGSPGEDGPVPVDEDPPSPAPRRPRLGRSGEEYFAELLESGGERAVQVDAKPTEPAIVWISRKTGNREPDELEDLAAEIAGDVTTSNLIKANADFRGYQDVVSFFAREFNPNGDPAIQQRIIEYVREWMEAQLIEAVMTVRNLMNGRTWDRRAIDSALSPHALTTVLMARFHIVERVKRALSSELAKPSKAA